MSVDLRLRHDRSLREQAADMFERGFGPWFDRQDGLGCPGEGREKMAADVPRSREGRLLNMGVKQARYDYRDQGRRSERRG